MSSMRRVWQSGNTPPNAISTSHVGSAHGQGSRDQSRTPPPIANVSHRGYAESSSHAPGLDEPMTSAQSMVQVVVPQAATSSAIVREPPLPPQNDTNPYYVFSHAQLQEVQTRFNQAARDLQNNQESRAYAALLHQQDRHNIAL